MSDETTENLPSRGMVRFLRSSLKKKKVIIAPLIIFHAETMKCKSNAYKLNICMIFSSKS